MATARKTPPKKAARKTPAKAKRGRNQVAADMRRELSRLTGLSGRGVTRARGRSGGVGGSSDSN